MLKKVLIIALLALGGCTAQVSSADLTKAFKFCEGHGGLLSIDTFTMLNKGKQLNKVTCKSGAEFPTSIIYKRG